MNPSPLQKTYMWHWACVKLTSLTTKIVNSSIWLTSLRSDWRTEGLTRPLAIAQTKQTDETRWGQRARYLAAARRSTLLPPAAGGRTQTVDAHLAGQSDRWLLARSVMVRTGQFKYAPSQMASHQEHSPLTPYSWTTGTASLPVRSSSVFSPIQLFDFSPQHPDKVSCRTALIY